MQLVGDHGRGSSVLVSGYIVAWIGIPIAVGIAYHVFRMHKSKILGQIAFAIWVIIVIIGSVGLWQPID
jgi:hypothetical protein